MHRFYPANSPVLPAANRGYRYGEGIFETALFQNGHLVFGSAHLERLCAGLALTGIAIPTYFNQAYVEEIAAQLVEKNNIKGPARIRISVTAGNGSLQQFAAEEFELMMEAVPTGITPATLDKPAWKTALFTGFPKQIHPLSAFKTASHLVYALAARYAVNHNLNDCILLNTEGMICDGGITNVFALTGNEIVTPPVSSGCINGILRRFLLQQLHEKGYAVQEKNITPGELENAKEIFLTNAIQGICPVETYNGQIFSTQFARQLAVEILVPFYTKA